MTKLGTTSAEVLREIEARASKDLSALVEAEAEMQILQAMLMDAEARIQATEAAAEESVAAMMAVVASAPPRGDLEVSESKVKPRRQMRNGTKDGRQPSKSMFCYVYVSG
jgi:hypothetical protein